MVSTCTRLRNTQKQSQKLANTCMHLTCVRAASIVSHKNASTKIMRVWFRYAKTLPTTKTPVFRCSLRFSPSKIFVSLPSNTINVMLFIYVFFLYFECVFSQHCIFNSFFPLCYREEEKKYESNTTTHTSPESIFFRSLNTLITNKYDRCLSLFHSFARTSISFVVTTSK